MVVAVVVKMMLMMPTMTTMPARATITECAKKLTIVCSLHGRCEETIGLQRQRQACVHARAYVRAHRHVHTDAIQRGGDRGGVCTERS